MSSFPHKLHKKLEERESENSIRSLNTSTSFVDFYSNDYIGFSRNATIFNNTSSFLSDRNIIQNGATGSRLISGNYKLYDEVELQIAKFHKVEAALLFNSGYDANLGFFSCIPQRGDFIFYDEYIHASIRDGIAISNAKSYKFSHNNLEDLKGVIDRVVTSKTAEVYIITESVFSMDGDSPDLKSFAHYCDSSDFNFIIDEAHAIGVFGENGEGLVSELGIQNQVFARIITFGKAMGCHGAAVLGSEKLKNFLINFARSFIYTTGLPPHSVATIGVAYVELHTKHENLKPARVELLDNIKYFNEQVEFLNLSSFFISSASAIHCCVISGNKEVKQIAEDIQEKGFNVKAILSPTVSIGQERIRFCLHSYNTKKEIFEVLSYLKEKLNSNE
ncbi:pyridoxal phosphate-dependent aminotransferase family protein [Cellulophaga sp. HaHaR_3_176]|uniref:aminotransferase class I/II-fold pyridoxal phosphate-dependent enzyme n=1 Tax=Cellulophaga sp. HaHaR_3_176 TaxID=1942464 RepID=UPI001C1FB4A9|nr:pyridoxal phosphate-dependent aminotransferase family protein [Cellulophaga sp. HaHaR_3_176]QWX83307.1 pyridoxal phosphate-dependent aminotransferase family protein [Cellulophaga sp. HaHaR_3_176]